MARSDGLAYLVRLETTGAYVNPPLPAIFRDTDLLEVRIEAPAGSDHRMAPRVSEGRLLAAAVTYLGHEFVMVVVRRSVRPSGHLLLQFGQRQHRRRGISSLIPLPVPGPLQRLLHRLAGDHAEGTRNAGIELNPHDARRGL